MYKNKTFTIAETRQMSEDELTVELGKHTKFLEELGMEHEEACKFVSSIGNIGIAFQEKWNSSK